MDEVCEEDILLIARGFVFARQIDKPQGVNTFLLHAQGCWADFIDRHRGLDAATARKPSYKVGRTAGCTPRDSQMPCHPNKLQGWFWTKSLKL